MRRVSRWNTRPEGDLVVSIVGYFMCCFSFVLYFVLYMRKRRLRGAFVLVYCASTRMLILRHAIPGTN
jgi:hypothetical protein